MKRLKFEVKKTSGMLPRSYLSFKTELAKDIDVCTKKGVILSPKLEIKISGDGARVSRVSNCIVISYSMTGLTESSQSHLNQSTCGC